MLNPVAHPLDPLSGDEFRAVASILQREHGVVAGAGGPAASNLGWRFASIELAEPGKTELRAFDDGGPPPRRAEVICLQRSNNTTYKSVVSLTDDRAESFEHIPGVQDVVSVWLKPFGLFDRNPSLDVVGTPPDMCHTPSTSAHH